MSWVNISTAKTTVVSSGPCYLDKIVVGGGTTGAITLYNSDGAVPNDKFLAMAPDQGSEDALGTYEFQVTLDALTIVTAAATDILVIYYTREDDGGVPG